MSLFDILLLSSDYAAHLALAPQFNSSAVCDAQSCLRSFPF